MATQAGAFAQLPVPTLELEELGVWLVGVVLVGVAVEVVVGVVVGVVELSPEVF